MQAGEELTVEEYAAAMEETMAAQEQGIEAAGAAFFSEPPYSPEEAERYFTLETSGSWSQEDVEFASDVAETLLQKVTGLYDEFLNISRDSFDAMSRLTPPEHLANLHDDFIAASRELLQLVQESVETVRGTDTNIGNREELADFMQATDSLESGPPDAELAERVESLCSSLEGQLESELERDVNICDPSASNGAEADPEVEPAPPVAGAAEPADRQAREAMPAPDSTSAETDREALIALYNATDGTNWTNNDNWLTDKPLNEWYGIATYATGPEVPVELAGRVAEIRLSENGLNGQIPPEMGQLSRLFVLFLATNQLSGPIPPEMGQLSGLVWLDLYSNQLSGYLPPELGRLSRLEGLIVSDNRLTGTIPAELGQLSNLEHLSLFSNGLTGVIPAELGKLARLDHLDLFSNDLAGVVPAELGKLAQLNYLDLFGNNLAGEIPAELGQLSGLDYLDLSDNDLTGEIPAELGQLSLLTEVYLAGNNLVGCVPGALGDVEGNDLDELRLPFC